MFKPKKKIVPFYCSELDEKLLDAVVDAEKRRSPSPGSVSRASVLRSLISTRASELGLSIDPSGCIFRKGVALDG